MTTLFLAIFSIAWLAAPSMAQDSRQRQLQKLNPQMPPPLKIDDDRVAAHGIRKLTGQHITLYTDIKDDPRVDQLVTVFDLAVPQWCALFNVAPEKAKPLHLTTMVMADEEKFSDAGLKPADLPKFLAGFNRGHEIWVKIHPGNYYTQHLLLHEGTHAFMQWMKGGSGPAWYSEGMAEKVALHQVKDGKLKIDHRIRASSEADYWGRIKIINEDFAAGNAMNLKDVMSIHPGAFYETRPRHYAWSWAACDFFSKHPLSKETFDGMIEMAGDSSRRFTRVLEYKLRDHWSDLERDWRSFVREADYGYASERAAMTETQKEEEAFVVATNRGWQDTQLSIKKGDQLKISASGKFEIRSSIIKGKRVPWNCQPGGVTIEYYRKRPLGMLLAGVLTDSEDGMAKEVRQWTEIGRGATLTAEFDGRLCLRINESPRDLEDNVGSLKVSVGR